MPNIERKIYYYPFYCYRCWPGLEHGLASMLNHLSIYGNIGIYQNLENARRAGEEMLCDDDTYGILIIDYTTGRLEIRHKKFDAIERQSIYDTCIKFFEIKD